MDFDNYNYTLLDRFLRYVKIDTESDPQATSFPSTERQKNLGKVLVEELQQIGIEDAQLDEYGYVYASLPANSGKDVPVICFCSHMDTSPDCSGKDVKPILHRQYEGGDIVLPDDPSQVLNIINHPALAEQIGNDIITASGTTLLGADNKAGLASIMDAVNYLVSHPEVKHGKIRILFTPDEEIGRGVDHVDMKKLAADYGYTIDGEALGALEDETFCADSAKIIIEGIAIHTGFAKGKLVNAVKVASAIIDKLPKESDSPETTEGKEGFIHPLRIEANGEKAEIEYIIRDFTEEGVKKYEDKLQEIINNVLKHFPGAKARLIVKEQYRNMKIILDQHPDVIANAEEAIKRAGVAPKLQSIRGGTDGARLSFMGLPCPNIFAGEHSFHSRQEWASVQDMQKAVKTIVNLAVIWEEKS